MDGDEEWDKAKYKNWVRGAKGLEYLQEGLQNFVGVNVQSHRDQTVQNTISSGSSVQCHQCTLQNLLPEHAGLNQCTRNTNTCIQHSSGNCFGNKPRGRRICPNGICSKLYDEIVRAHRFKDPMWRNTDPGTWCSDPAGWSFAKCFQTTPNPGTSSSETDAAGLLSVILSDKLFQNEVSCKLAAKPNIFSSAREIRNDILHSPKMELEDSILKSYIDVFITVLQDPTVLLNDQGAVEVVQKLLQLKNDEITISLSEQVKLIQIKKDALNALEQLEEKEKKVVAEIEEREQDTLAKIEGATSEALEKINESDIKKRVQDAEDKIEQLTHTMRGYPGKPADTVLSSSCNVPSSRNKPSSLDGNEIEFEDSDPDTKKVISEALNVLIDYMKPDPVVDCAINCDLLGVRQGRDIKEGKNTTEKNRDLLEKVILKGKSGYAKLKDCLMMTGQSKLVEVLECIEKGEDPSIIGKQIHEKTILEMKQPTEDSYLQCTFLLEVNGNTHRYSIKPLNLLVVEIGGHLLLYGLLKCVINLLRKPFYQK